MQQTVQAWPRDHLVVLRQLQMAGNVRDRHHHVLAQLNEVVPPPFVLALQTAARIGEIGVILAIVVAYGLRSHRMVVVQQQDFAQNG